MHTQVVITHKIKMNLVGLLCFVLFFAKGSHCIALISLELTMETRVVSNAQRSACF